MTVAVAKAQATRTEIETCSGLYLDYVAPDPATICVEDVARALSHVCRFAGHTACFYSVAEHALLVRRLVIEAGHPELARAALHHDSHEAYIGDVPTPLKNLLGEAYRTIRDQVDLAISAALGLSLVDLADPIIRQADRDALRIEASVLKASRGFTPAWGFEGDPPEPPVGWMPGMAPTEAEWAFLGADDTDRLLWG